MDNEKVKIFRSLTDASAVNRGYYFQYLLTLKKWISNFIDGKEVATHCEVDDDIKEVGNELSFTQVKCYSKQFSLQSSEVKKSLFHFFMLFLENSNQKNITFFFTTNTKLAKREKLLKTWISDPKLNDNEIFIKIKLVIQKTLITVLKEKKNRKLNRKNISVGKKVEIKEVAKHLQSIIKSNVIDVFVKSIKWEFLNRDPITAIQEITIEIDELLLHEKFSSLSPSIMKSVLLSEIFRCSQLTDEKSRVLSPDRIDLILQQTSETIKSYVDSRFLSLFNLRFDAIELRLDSVEKNQATLQTRVSDIENDTREKYPKELTLLPHTDNVKAHGLEDSLTELKENLEKNNHLIVHGEVGIGKTLLMKKYLNESYNEFDHIIWIDASIKLEKAFILNEVLIDNLKIKMNSSLSIDRIINKLKCCEGRNLIFIDNHIEDEVSLRKIVALRNWKTLVSTRKKIAGLNKYRLSIPNPDNAKKIYIDNCDQESDEHALDRFLKFIQYNPLVIKLCARTIKNSSDITLTSLLDSMLNQSLDNTDYEIELELEESDIPTTLLSYLKEKFNLQGLTQNEKHYLSFLALLQLEFIDIDDLAMIGGKEDYRTNLLSYTNWTNSLQKKGWVEREGERIKLNRIVQEIILYVEREKVSPFVGNMFEINWLIHRIDENALVEPEKSFRFLKYAEAILNSIKEADRSSIYQPLLILELTLLNSYNWLNETDKLHQRWLNLVSRAERYLDNNDGNLAIMYNNLGLSFAKNDSLDRAVENFKKSISIFRQQKDDSKRLLLNAFNNLIQTYLINNDLDSTKKIIEETEDYIISNSIDDSQFIAAFYHRKVGYEIELGNYTDATNYCDQAIVSHLLIDVKKRNDMSLELYLNDMVNLILKIKANRINSKNVKSIIKRCRSKSILNKNKKHLIFNEVELFYINNYGR